MIKTDYLVIGGGIAGLSFALRASETGSVALVTKRALSDCGTANAQGGIATVWSPDDSFEKHIEDTLMAGAGLCDRKVVELVVREGPLRVRELIDWGVHFTASEEDPDRAYELGLEAGHSRRRILHAGDITGAEIEKALVEQAAKRPSVSIFEDHVAVDLITTGKLKRQFAGKDERCWGAYVLDKKRT
jgi:Aspartate oxidase